MSFEALAQHLASRNSLRIYDIIQDPEDVTKYTISPEEFDGVDHAAGTTMLCRMADASLSGSGKTVTISATITNGEVLPDLPIVLGTRVAAINTIQAFQLVQNGEQLEFQLLNLLNVFDLEEDIETLKDLGFTLVYDGGTPVLVESTYKIVAKGGLEVKADQKIVMPNTIHITPLTKVYIVTEDVGTLDAGNFLTEATVESLIVAAIQSQLNDLIVRDERTPSEYEFENNVSLPNGTIYFQLNGVLEE